LFIGGGRKGKEQKGELKRRKRGQEVGDKRLITRSRLNSKKLTNQDKGVKTVGLPNFIGKKWGDKGLSLEGEGECPHGPERTTQKGW